MGKTKKAAKKRQPSQLDLLGDKPFVRRCNACNKKTDGVGCAACGCPEFRLVPVNKRRG